MKNKFIPDFNVNDALRPFVQAFAGITETQRALKGEMAKGIQNSALAGSKLLDDLIKNLNTIEKEMERIQNSPLAGTKSLVEQFGNNIEGASKSWNSSIEKAVNTILERLQKAKEQYEEHEKRLRKKMKNDDIFLTPYFDNLIPKQVDKLFLQREDKNTIEIYHDFFSYKENIHKLLKYWNEFRSFKKRFPIIKKALEAHLEKNFELSIPVLIIQFEGILCEILEIEKYARSKKNKKNLKKKGPENLPKEYEEIFLQALDSDIFKSLSDKKNPNFNKEFSALNYANRPLITHGRDIFYYEKPIFSTKIIILLDFLTIYLQEDNKK